MRVRTLVVTAATLAVLASGCASGDPESVRSASTGASSARSGGSADGDEMQMEGMDMGSADRPSAPASMICTAEIRGAVRRTFAMRRPPTSTRDWSVRDRLLSCAYDVPGGTLRLSVQDALDDEQGRTYFEDLRGRLDGARRITGMDALGFPAFSTAAGDVVFLKDGKTLQVDATDLPARALPRGYTRSEAAYSVASAVIACWTE